MVNPYANVRQVEKVLIIAVSSDRGLCGGFNSSVFKAARQLVEKKYKEQNANDNVYYLPIGKKAADYFTKRSNNVIGDYKHLFGDLNFEDARKAAEFAMEGFLDGKFDIVELVFNEFKNVATQIIRADQFLPIPEVKSEEDETMQNTDYLFEPSKEEIIKDLIPNSLKVKFYKSLLESNASEQGARMTAMEKATENANELLKELRLTYNRTRQAAITKEILEIVGGAEALSSN
jgi:F-type H+-transporting ATPase subunit gamma